MRLLLILAVLASATACTTTERRILGLEDKPIVWRDYKTGVCSYIEYKGERHHCAELPEIGASFAEYKFIKETYQ